MNQMNALSAKFVRVSLAVLAVLSMLLVPGLGPASGVQAQDPDVRASSVTRTVSASVNINQSETFTGNKTVAISRPVDVSFSVGIRCWSAFTIYTSASIAGNVPVTVSYGFPLRVVNQSVAMGGTHSGSAPQPCPVGGGVFDWPVSFTVTTNGSLALQTQGSETGAIIQGNGTVSGPATVTLGPGAQFINYAYLPIIAKPDQSSGGGAWSDDFSTNKGWKNLSPDICEVKLVDGTMQVTLKKGDICWISTPDGVSLSQGTFTVDATRTSDKKGWYGLVFNTTTKLLEQRWQFDVAQWSASDGCESGKSKVKLSYKDGGAGNQWTDCTSKVKPNKEDWNRLQVVRNGDNVRASINGSERFNVNESRLKDAGLFDLVVWGNEAGFVVRFDNFDIR